ncbi:MAG: GNAT family N-acetyltransferase [Bacteroidetes bacterium]|nr:GNAT family N-acetyltransferase [Bacteroidota bacterium]
MSDYQIRQTTTDGADILGAASLLREVFGKPELFTAEYVKWQYADNPDGGIVGFNAYDGETLAAHYVTQPMQAVIDGQKRRGLLSLNTATHPGHQGKGLFVKLADRTYQYAAEQGYEFIVGVANQNSVHGFTKKLGFQLAGQLHALLGMGTLPYTDDLSSYSYYKDWSPEALAWRLCNPVNKYGVCTAKAVTVSSATAYPAISATLGRFDKKRYQINPCPASFSMLNLWIGVDRNITSKTNFYFNIPNRLRPAPLYLIFKPLKGGIGPLHFDDVYFQALDFDAY